LSPNGGAQARAAAGALVGAGLTAVVSSDLQRAQRTAETIAERLDLGQVTIDPGIRERDVGEFSGLTRDEIDAKWPGMIDRWRRGEVQRAPGGEGPEFIERVLVALDRIAEQFPGQRVLVVTHGGVIRTTQRHLGGEPGTLANLGGLWLHLADGAWRPGDAWLLPQS
jgi:probable phosphoglycerate mutase